VFLGGTRARYADSVSSTGAFVSLRLGTGQGARAAHLEGSFSQFADAGWALQIAGQGAVLWRGRGWWGGLAAGGSFNDFQNGTPSGIAAGGPLALVQIGRSFVTAGLTGGAVRQIDSTWMALASASVRWQVAPALGPLSVDLGAVATKADTLAFADFSVGGRVVGAGVRLAGVLGVRAGDLSDGAWGSLEGAWIPHPRVTLEATAGRYPRDLTGFAQGVYAQLGVRLYALGAGRRTIPAPRPPTVWAEPRNDGRVQVTVRLGRAAHEVALAGDWNGWEPVPLTQDGDVWSAVLPIPPGARTYAIIADGEWTLPEGVIGTDDGFGGKVAVLVVGAPGPPPAR